MLNARLYRAAFVPFALALAIAAFSLSASPPVLTSTLAPDAFDGASAFAELQHLSAEFPRRRPGGAGDEALARRVATTIRELGGTAGGGFSVHVARATGETIEGQRTLSTVVAERAGSTGEAPIVIMAHRDAASRGSAAELSGTAALLELARVFATSETRRMIILVSTSGGSGGDAGAAGYAASANGPLDAAIVLGDLAGSRASKPTVVPYSQGFGSAPLQLQRTVAAAIMREAASRPGAPSVLGQLSHLAFPLTPGEQGPLDAAGIPAVLVQVSGERGPAPHASVSAARLEGYGRGVLSAVDALDAAPNVSSTMQTGVLVQRQTIPAWAWRLLLGTLMLPALAVAADWLARLRRRRRGAPVGRCALWTLACALPFFAAAVCARLLGLLGALPAAPAAPAMSGALPFDGVAARSVAATALVFVLAWLLWPAMMRRVRLGERPDPEVAGLALVLVLGADCLVVWALDPYTALLLIVGLHVSLLIASPELRPRPAGALALLALALAPLALLVAFYAQELGLGPAGVAWTIVRLLAGGHVSLPGAALWCIAFGCAVAAAMLALAPREVQEGPSADDRPITIRGPRSYAGPGSLGGTESALRR